MRSTRRYPGNLGVEQLEDRCLLAGNVTAAVLHGSLIVTGDPKGNNIQILQTAQGIEVRAVSDQTDITTVNGGTSFTAVGLTKDVIVDMGGGNDGVAAAFNAPRDLILSLGGGDDALTFGGFFEPPSGLLPNVTSVHVGRNLDITMGPGADFLGIFEGTQVGGDTSIDLGGGDNIFTLSGSASFPTTFGGQTDISGGAGADFFDISNTTFGGQTQIKTGPGDDTLSLQNCTFQHKVDLDGGNGTDTLVNVGNTFAATPHIKGFEA